MIFRKVLEIDLVILIFDIPINRFLCIGLRLI